MEQFQKNYLDHLGLLPEFKAEYVPCEICDATEFTVIREIVCIGKGAYGKLPVVSCNRCGFLFQNPRFERSFYDAYYGHVYRNVVLGNSDPGSEFVEDQINRGEFLFQNLERFLPKSGELLDVGCSCGGLMKAFMDRGWKAYGTDPDAGFTRYGREVLRLPVEEVPAEKMQLEERKYDLVIITGSLEHVFDPNLTLEICRKAVKQDSLILLEGRGHPQKASRDYFNHNHHRYFTFTSMQNILRKHGWTPILTTDDPLCGPTRPGTIFCLARLSPKPSREDFLLSIERGDKEAPLQVLEKFDRLDASKMAN